MPSPVAAEIFSFKMLNLTSYNFNKHCIHNQLILTLFETHSVDKQKGPFSWNRLYLASGLGTVMRIPSNAPRCKMGSPQLMGINMAPPYYSFKNCAGMTYFIIWQSNILKCLHVCVRMCPPLFLINITWYTYVCMTFYFFTKYLL